MRAVEYHVFSRPRAGLALRKDNAWTVFSPRSWFLALALQWFRPRHNAQLQLLAAQIRILRSRIDISLIVPTPKEKAELLRLGALLGNDVAEVMQVVQRETCRSWVRQSRHGVFTADSGAFLEQRHSS